MIDLTKKLESAHAKATARAVIEHAIETLSPEEGADLLVDILAAITIAAPRVQRVEIEDAKPARRVGEIEGKILAALADGPNTVDEISEKVHGSGVTGSEIKKFHQRTANALSHMKAKGLVENDGRGTWRQAAGTSTETNTNGASEHA